jgi:hypothetical protein
MEKTYAIIVIKRGIGHLMARSKVYFFWLVVGGVTHEVENKGHKVEVPNVGNGTNMSIKSFYCSG